MGFPGVMWPVGFGYSKAVTAADTGENCKNAIGLHNSHATEGGIVKITYDNGLTDSIYFAPGVYVGCRPKLVWSTGTDADIVDDIHALYG